MRVMAAKASTGNVARGILGAALAALVWTPAESQALINPKFTPLDLVKQSQVILELKFQPEIKRGKAAAAVVRALKGTSAKRSLEFDLTSTTYADQAALVRKTIREAKDKPAMMFFGGLSDKPGGQSAEPSAAEAGAGKAYVHLEGMWIALCEDQPGAWAFDQVSQPMVATWNGGTDMLLRAVEYILKSPAAEMPVRTGVTWAAAIPAGRVAGKVSAAVAVDLAGDGRLLLMVASDAGDHLFAFQGNAAQDVTAKHNLQSKSLAFAWADFNADGRLDLASWDGKSLTIHVQGPDGTFSPSAGGHVRECIGLAAVDVGTKGKAGLIVSTQSAPLLLMPGPAAEPAPLAAGAWPGGELGQSGPCLVADFDNHGLPDVLQPLAKGSLLYRGTRPGGFAPPVACPVALEPRPASVCLGDWDGDGLLDLFVAGEDGCRLWQNLGGGQFLECLKLSGEVGYVARRGAVTACLGDLNNDGRQDVAILYSTVAPQVFFNRGFRSFGCSQSLDLERGSVLRQAAQGQQAGCLADFTGHGAQDLALVLRDGTCALLVRTPTGSDLCARAVLPAKSRSAGPVAVQAAVEDRPLGAWNVTAGGAGAFLARPEAGPVTIKWRFPGGKLQTRQVILEDRPVTIVLEPEEEKR